MQGVSRDKAKRYSWFKTAAEKRKGWHTLLLVLHCMGINKKWWSSISDVDFATPGLGVSSGREAALGAAVGAGAALPAADAPRTVADGSLEVDRMRKDCKHTLHFTARTMSNRYVLRSVCVPGGHGTSTYTVQPGPHQDENTNGCAELEH